MRVVQSWPKKIVLGCVISPLWQQANHATLDTLFGQLCTFETSSSRTSAAFAICSKLSLTAIRIHSALRRHNGFSRNVIAPFSNLRKCLGTHLQLQMGARVIMPKGRSLLQDGTASMAEGTLQVELLCGADFSLRCCVKVAPVAGFT